MRDRKVRLRKGVMALGCIVSGVLCTQTPRNVDLGPEEMFIRDTGQGAVYTDVMEVSGRDKTVQERLQEIRSQG